MASEESFVAINTTLEVDFLGQCASESLGSEYWSSSGGQSDFARGALLRARPVLYRAALDHRR
jgi:acyl-CoA hydrolase